MQGIGVSAGRVSQHFSLFVANQIGNVFDFPSLIPKVFTILIFSRSKVNFISAKLRKVCLLWNLILLQHESHSILVQGPKGRGICIQYSTNCFASGLFHQAPSHLGKTTTVIRKAWMNPPNFCNSIRFTFGTKCSQLVKSK